LDDVEDTEVVDVSVVEIKVNKVNIEVSEVCVDINQAIR
jgi:hypothetical protein